MTNQLIQKGEETVMPRGTFVPFNDCARFFARPRAFTLECPFCGELFFIGKGARDAKCFNRRLSMIRCASHIQDGARREGCGREFLVGMVAYPLTRRGRNSPKATTPPDQIPEPHQLEEIRAEAARRRRRFARRAPE
jgi:hypothetical protein